MEFILYFTECVGMNIEQFPDYILKLIFQNGIQFCCVQSELLEHIPTYLRMEEYQIKYLGRYLLYVILCK